MITPNPVEQYIEEMGELFKGLGRQALEGRFVALLLTQARPVSLKEAAEALSVSRGSLSTLANAMIERGDVLRSGNFSTREHLYRLVDRVYVRDLIDRREASRRLSGLASRLAAGAPTLEPEAVSQLTYYAGLHSQAALGLDGVLSGEERLQAAYLKQDLEEDWDALPAASQEQPS